jgi:phenylacetate-CoA ligase
LTTSGSTGRPLKLFISEAEDDWRKAIYMRANICCGQKPRDKWVVIAGPRHFGSTTKLQTVLGIYAQTYISVFDDVSTQASRVRSLKPDVLDGYSSSILLLAKQIQKTGQKAIQPRIVFGNAEVIDGSSREYIEKVFDAPYYDQYGCVEFNRTAWQCSEQTNYHMDVDSVITQFVDKDGNEVYAGERGEIVQTSLFNYAMPFIRYEVGDVGVPSDDECSCGRKLPLIKTVEGRTDSLIMLPDGRMLSPRMLTAAVNMFDQYESIEQFRIVQKKLNLLEILIKIRNTTIDKQVMETSLVAHVNRMLHLDEGKMTFEVKFVDDIAPSKSGKLMSVVSELKPYVPVTRI